MGNNSKYEVANELGIPLKKGDNGEMTASDAGKIGGIIGGNIVKEMVQFAEQQLMNNRR
ncbi:small, acid-soluble spore protein, alpha/beta type [Schinkia sp. CFF1]